MDFLRAVLSLALALGLLWPLPAAGQAPPRGGAAQEEESVFGETIDVRVVNLEVVVVDGDGRRVSGLAASELRLKVDGKPVPIDYFTEVAEGRAVAEGAGAAGAPPAVAGVTPGGEVGTSYLLFLDDSFTSVNRDRNIVLQGLIDELSRLRPQDRMAVVAFSGKTPELLANWSRPAAVRPVLERAMRQPGRGLAATANLEHAAAVADVGEAPEPIAGIPTPSFPGPPLVDQAPNEACMLVRKYESTLQKAASALTATLRSLSGAPGRKVALVAAGGWPRSVKEYVFGGNISRWPAGCKVLDVALWDDVHKVANQVGFTLYPVLIPELGQAVAAEGDDYPVPLNPLEGASQVQETLQLLARETGGEAFAGGARRDLLARVADDTRSYYWLGFTPTWKGDDRGHRVEVEVTRPGLSVRSRLGFQDLSRKTEITNRVESALLFGDPPGVLPLKAELGALPAKKGRKDTVRVPLKLTIPMDHVTMIRKGRQYVAELELRVALLDEKGNRNDIPVIPVQLAGPQPPAPGQHAVYETEVEVRRIEQDVVVALFDPPSGKLMKTRTVLKP